MATDETRVSLFIRKVKDLAERSQQDPVLVAIGFIYVILHDLLEKMAGAAGMFKAEVTNIRKREDK